MSNNRFYKKNSVNSIVLGKIEKNIVSKIFQYLFKTGNIRLDFLNYDSVYVGNGEGELVSITAPKLIDLMMIILHPNMMFGEKYMQGRLALTSGDLVKLICYVQMPAPYSSFIHNIVDHSNVITKNIQKFNFYIQSKKRAKHYNIDHSFYKLILDSELQYSCAFFNSPSDSLEVAQQNKISTIIERLSIDSNCSVLDIGCGWGRLANNIALKTKAKVTGITLSVGQYNFCLQNQNTSSSNAEQNPVFLLEDYKRFLPSQIESYDRIVSIGMLEHIGPWQYDDYFTGIRQSLKEDGLALIHLIVKKKPGKTNSWIRKYIFPGCYLPSLSELLVYIEKSGLYMDEIFFHTPSDYYRTIDYWRNNFYDNMDAVEEKYDEKFIRMFDFYLAGVQSNFTCDIHQMRIVQIRLKVRCV
ncbi:MAG: class I SAM-dependent methyltransferase [Magnetococcales bacterium]|nr:class I SAM-dependent methyltransferase [Magnetococcales bacterium]